MIFTYSVLSKLPLTVSVFHHLPNFEAESREGGLSKESS